MALSNEEDVVELDISGEDFLDIFLQKFSHKRQMMLIYKLLDTLITEIWLLQFNFWLIKLEMTMKKKWYSPLVNILKYSLYIVYI